MHGRMRFASLLLMSIWRIPGAGEDEVKERERERERVA